MRKLVKTKRRWYIQKKVLEEIAKEQVDGDTDKSNEEPKKKSGKQEGGGDQGGAGNSEKQEGGGDQGGAGGSGCGVGGSCGGAGDSRGSSLEEDSIDDEDSSDDETDGEVAQQRAIKTPGGMVPPACLRGVMAIVQFIIGVNIQ